VGRCLIVAHGSRRCCRCRRTRETLVQLSTILLASCNPPPGDYTLWGIESKMVDRTIPVSRHTSATKPKTPELTRLPLFCVFERVADPGPQWLGVLFIKPTVGPSGKVVPPAPPSQVPGALSHQSRVRSEFLFLIRHNSPYLNF